MILFIILSAIIIGLVEGIPLIKRKMHKELYAVLFLLLTAIVLHVSYSFGITTPKALLEKYLDPFGRAFFKQPLS